MSEPIKFKTFRDLRTLPKEENLPASTSISSISSNTRIPSSTSISSIDDLKAKKVKLENISPVRDYQKVPNSVTRVAIPSGMFRGKSKQVWDYFWSISRGAINPTRTFKKSRKEIKDGSGLGSMVTVDAAIEHLQTLGLVKVNQTIGSGRGNEYEIFSPDEIESTYTSRPSISSNTSLTQKVDILDIPLSSISSITQTTENKDTYDTPKTSFKDNTKNDDDARVSETFLPMAKRLDAAVKKLTGKGVSKHEAEKWNDFADLIILELEIAAKRTDSISSVPAFLTEVLRRQFFATRQEKSSAKSPNRKIDTVGKSNSDSFKIKPLDAKGREAALEQLREFAADDFLQDFKKWYMPEDWSWLMKQLEKLLKKE